jgi:type IV pilus secretin PilQ/predicted competence protein
MRLQMPHVKSSRLAATLLFPAVLAVAGGMSLSAGSAPVRLVGVSAQGNQLFIEASEPVSYVVNRPDPLTVVVELRNVSVASAANVLEHRDPIAAVSLEQAVPVDGKALARVRVSLARPYEYAVRSARNTIRLELTPTVRGATAVPVSATPAVPGATPGPAAAPAPRPADAPATILDRVRTSRTAAATTVTLGGNGRLTPADVSEAPGAPRRLVLDFPNVASKAPAQTNVEGSLVARVRVGVNSREPLLTRVVMEVAEGATYHVERAGADGGELAVVFEPPQSAKTIMLTAPSAPASPSDVEPDIPLQQAIANAASITPKEDAADPISALKTTPAAKNAAPVPAAPAAAAPAPAPRRAAAQSSRAAAAVAQPQPAATPSATAAASGGAVVLQGAVEKKYTGNPITLDFSGADLRTVLKYFHEISGLSIIIDPSVPATPIDIVLTDIPWDQAFETLLRSYKLGYTAEGTIVRIAPISILAEEEGERRKLSEAKALAGDLRVQTFSLSYAKANDMQPLLVKSALSARGQIQVDPRTNTIIITDLPDRLQTATALISSLDRPEPQVEVEARVVQTTRAFARAIGVQWGFNGRATPAIGNTTGLAFPNSGTLGGRTGATNAPTDIRSTDLDKTSNAVNLAVPGATSAVGLALGAVNGAFNLDVALTALESSGQGRVLSTPRLTTQNNVAAEVAQGVQIPIQTVANNTVTVSFKDAVLTLKVTPQITSANTVIMQITLENATPDFSRQVNGIPPIDTQRATTQVQVDDGATTIIGGIFVSREQTSNERTPLLYRVPLLGWLFKRDTNTDESRELLIFITPRILRG